MGRMPWGTYLWPGLPQICREGSWAGLGLAIGFAALVSGAVADRSWTLRTDGKTSTERLFPSTEAGARRRPLRPLPVFATLTLMNSDPQRQFTPGAERVLDEAARWSRRDDPDDIEAPSLLLGLLAEAECRAAIVMAGHGIDAAGVKNRWPELKRHPAGAPPPGLSADVRESLSAAVARLHEHPKDLILATEHLLLGLAAADHETGQWLRRQGVDPDSLERDIQAQYGHTPGPLPAEEPETLELPPESEFDRAVEEDAAEPTPSIRPLTSYLTLYLVW